MRLLPCPALRRGRILLWTAGVLFLVLVGLVLYQKFYAGGQRFVGDVDLIEELGEVVFVEDRADTKPWAQWRGPDRAGITSMPDLLRTWPAKGPAGLWSQAGGDGYSSFSVADGRAFTMVEREEKAEAVLCLDLKDGKTVWEKSFGLNKTFQYGGPRPTPTLVEGKLFTGTSDGVLLCLRQTDGKILWQTDMKAEVSATPPKWGFAFSPLVLGKYVYAMPGGSGGQSLAAFDRDTGKLAWASQDDPAGYSSPVAATIDGVSQIIFFTGRRLLGVTPDAGKLLWEYPWETNFQVNAATPLVIQGRAAAQEITYVFLSSGYAKGCALVKVSSVGKDRFAAKAVYESNELCCHFASPVRFKEHIYGLDETRDLTCLDLRTGKVAWRFAKDDNATGLRNVGFKKGSLLRVDDLLLLLGEDGKLALVPGDPKEYRELAAARPFRRGNKCWTVPVLADGRLLLRDQKTILCLDVKKGAKQE